MSIKLENLKKEYTLADGTRVNAVNGVSLEIPSNTIYGIIGKSGAGKSTLVRLVSLLERPDSGAVYYDDKRVDDLKKYELIEQRRHAGMIFQNFNLFSSRSAAGNIAYPLEICKTPKDQIKKRVEELLALVGLEGRGDAKISSLSGGQKQRVAIARALANYPSILFCDEATSALDPQTTRAILELIKDLQKKMSLTVVMITHQMEVVRDACSLVSVLDEGRVVEEGSVSDIFTRPKAAITKEFMANIRAANFVQWSDQKGGYVLRFEGDLTDKTLVSELIKKFDIEVNIRGGGIQNVQDKKVGVLRADISGAELQKAIAFLKDNGVIVQEERGE
ncbi:MAG: methionine ABC transporter ATP-binding protein [Treponema sp.]|nr:methionine ABC transporter ATP-binding protein [Treponema sp.]